MDVFLNGRFVPEEQAVVSFFDRGLVFGDGIFETLRVYAGGPFLWDQHLQRFQQGADLLDIIPPLTADEMRQVLHQLLQRNKMENGIVRILLTRGAGPRGYSPKGADHPTLGISLHPVGSLPKAFQVILSSVVLPSNDPLAAAKNCNKIRQVLARAEADRAGADEALIRNDRGHVVEGASTNLFWIEEETLCTPPVKAGILPGATRAHVCKLAAKVGLKVKQKSLRPAELKRVRGLFLTSSAIEIMPVSKINQFAVRASPIVPKLQKLYRLPL